MTSPSRTLRAALTGWLVASAFAVAQTTPPAAPVARNDTIQLSPFEVAAGQDSGYSASGTLAGTRLRTELRDVAASISVVTKQLMDDLGRADSMNS